MNDPVAHEEETYVETVARMDRMICAAFPPIDMSYMQVKSQEVLSRVEREALFDFFVKFFSGPPSIEPDPIDFCPGFVPTVPGQVLSPSRP